MNGAWLLATLLLVVPTACESTDDILNRIDHTVPSVLFNPDTLEVNAGGSLTINALVEDESGIQRIEFTYGDWRINNIIDLTGETGTGSYPFSLDITVPENALKQWEESLYFNDGTSIKVTQEYHRLLLSAWDKNRNLQKSYVYVRVRRY